MACNTTYEVIRNPRECPTPTIETRHEPTGGCPSCHIPTRITDQFQERGIDLYVHKDAIDTGTASGRIFFHIVGAIGEFERERIRERINAGLARARSEGGRLGRPEGTTKAKVKHQDEIVSLRDAGMSIRKIADALNVSTSTVQTALKRAL